MISLGISGNWKTFLNMPRLSVETVLSGWNIYPKIFETMTGLQYYFQDHRKALLKNPKRLYCMKLWKTIAGTEALPQPSLAFIPQRCGAK
jgi:hypothetical protein